MKNSRTTGLQKVDESVVPHSDVSSTSSEVTLAPPPTLRLFEGVDHTINEKEKIEDHIMNEKRVKMDRVKKIDGFFFVSKF